MNIICSTKYFLALIIFISFFLKRNINYIENNNKISEYEENLVFSEMKARIKPIALYLPQFHEIKENDEFWGKGFTEWTNVKKCLPLYKSHHQPRIPGDKFGYLSYYDLSDVNNIKKQVELAKSHGIYGFGIYYYWFSGKQLLEKPLNLFIKYSNIYFHFLLIWANENWTKKWDGKDNEILMKQEYKLDDPKNYIKDIKKYLTDKRYIKIENKPVLGIYEPNKIQNLTDTIQIWREKSKKYGIGEIFILICINNNKTQDFQNLNLFDATYEFPPRNSFQNHRIPNKRTFIYSELLYKSMNFNEKNTNFEKLPFFRGSMVEWDNCPRMNNCEIFDYYSPQQFYLYNKIIIEWTIKHYNKDFRFIFINAWNEWGEGSYLEPDDKYGYASINSLSKAIFNLSYFQNYNLTYLNETNKIVVIAYIDTKDLIEEIIDKSNNIPSNFDLFIYIDNIINIDKLKEYIKINSKAYHFEMESSLNQKKFLFDFILDFKNNAKNYKYICFINSNPKNNIDYSKELKNYLHNNLLGNSEIVSEILTDFENHNNLGLIFPEKYYKSLYKFGDKMDYLDLKYINTILKRIFPDIRVSPGLIDFPEGNMFWANIKAIYSVFNINSYPIPKRNFNLIVENYLEKIWVYIVKKNGYSYRKIFKHI